MRHRVVNSVILIGLAALNGCVSQEAYDRQREIADHLRAVKTEQDISLSSLQGDVLALKGGYKSQSAVVTGLEALARATSTELQTMQTRISGLGTDQLQLRAELGRVGVQMAETVRLLERVTQQQTTLDASLTSLSQRVGDLKKPSSPKPTSHKLTDSPVIPDMSKLLQVPSATSLPGRGTQQPIDDRTAVERALAQKSGQGGMFAQSPTPVGGASPPPVVAQPAVGQAMGTNGVATNGQSPIAFSMVNANAQSHLRGQGEKAVAVTPPSQLVKADAGSQPQNGIPPKGIMPQEDVSPLVKKPDAPVLEKKGDVPFWRVPFERLAALFSSSDATASTPVQPAKAE